MAMYTLSDVRTWRDAKVVDCDGDKVGSVNDIYLDRQTGEPAWLAINTGLFGMNVSFVPIEGVTRDGEDLRLPFDKDRVKDAPNIDPEGQLTPQEEQALYAHYGREWGEVDEDRFSREPRLSRYETQDPGRTI
jgi:hypothetical protein